MTDWIQLTTDTVLAQFNDSETGAYDAAKGDANGLDLTEIITSVSNQIRKAYLDGGRTLDFTTPASIPEGEVNRAVAIIRWLYLLALPTGQSLQTPERKKAQDDAAAYLLAVARRELKHAGSVGIARPGMRVQDFNALGSTGGQRGF